MIDGSRMISWKMIYLRKRRMCDAKISHLKTSTRLFFHQVSHVYQQANLLSKQEPIFQFPSIAGCPGFFNDLCGYEKADEHRRKDRLTPTPRNGIKLYC